MAGKLTLYADALAAALSDTTPITQTEIVPANEARGRILAKPLVAQLDTPPADNSSMDGYGVAKSALGTGAEPVRLDVSGASLAGHPHKGAIAEGTAIRIATGAVIPEGVDTIIIQEDVAAGSEEEGFIQLNTDTISETVQGQHIRRRGDDVHAGDTILSPGHRLRSQDLAIASSQGVSELEVFRKLKVAVYATGDELREPGQPLQEGQIYESNRIAMIGVLEEAGIEVTNLGMLKDNFEALQTALKAAAAEHDAIVTSGGVSVGKADLLKPVVDSIGSIQAWKMAMKPGMPVMRGRIGGCMVFGLPGNPVSTMISMRVFVRPILTKLMGGHFEGIRGMSVPAGFSWKRRAGRREWVRARLEQNEAGQWVAKMYHGTGSHQIRSMVWAEGLIEVPEDTDRIALGDIIRYIPLSEL